MLGPSLFTARVSDRSSSTLRRAPIGRAAISAILLASLLGGCRSHERAPIEIPPSGVSAVSMETSLTCAIDDEGAVRCHGYYSGFVGSRVHGIDDASIPLPIADAIAIDVSADHGCAATADGAVSCWGFNTYGQLGLPAELSDESEGFHATPVRVEGIDDAIGVAVGWLFSCALRATGEVLCWGSSGLGPGPMIERGEELPRALPGVADVVEIEADGSVACARSVEGQVRCFGEAAYDVQGTSPTDGVGEIAGLPADIFDIDVSRYAAVAIDARGDIWNWGMTLPNRNGEHGESFAHHPTPERIGAVPGGRSVIANQLRGGTLCVLRDDGSLACWGENGAGQLGRGYAETGPLAAPVAPPFEDATVAPPLDSVALSGARTCGIARGDHTLLCWGNDGDGALLGGGTVRAPIEAVTAVVGASALAIGAAHACAIDTERRVVCWGSGAYGRLGNGSERSSAAPIAVPGLSAVDALALSATYSCALADGSVLCWGSNHDGVARGGIGEDVLSPTIVALPGRALAISAGARHACALVETDAGSRIACWGSNDRGQLANERFDEIQSPTVIESFGEVRAIAVGDDATCAVTARGVLCVGDRDRTALGVPATFDPMYEERIRNGQYEQRYVVTEPVLVPSTEGAHDLEVRGLRACAWLDGSSTCWGDDLGAPIARAGEELTPILELAASGTRALALCSVRDADACVGIDGAPMERVLPARDLVALDGSSQFECGITAAMEVICWGNGPEGELGDGLAFALTPAPL